MTPPTDPPNGWRLFRTPEEATLDGWRSTPAAQARVISVEPSPEFGGVWVTVQINDHSGVYNRDISHCLQSSDGHWFEVASFGG